MASTEDAIKDVSREIDELLSSIRGTLELLAISEFDDDIYIPSLTAIERIAGTHFENQHRA
jgi:hypothetical protein